LAGLHSFTHRWSQALTWGVAERARQLFDQQNVPGGRGTGAYAHAPGGPERDLDGEHHGFRAHVCAEMKGAAVWGVGDVAQLSH
jgi:hypothetical protein